MTEEKNNRDVNKILFINLVMMLASSAMQQLGKIVNPLTNKTEVNMEGARASIDMLSMLQEKTKGNLDADEGKMLDDLLSSLQMNYVETAGEQKTPGGNTDATGKATEKEPSPPETTPPAEDTKSPSESEEKEEQTGPRFRKSYGS